MAAEGAKKVLIYGGRGALGNVLVQHFKSAGWWVGAIDLRPNEEAHGNVTITNSESLVEQEKEIVSGVKNLLGDSKLDAILCVAGGWAGGNTASADFVQNTDLMLKQSVWSSVIASRLSSLYLTSGGLLTLTGARAGLHPTPDMLAYGLAKGAVHQLVRSLGDPKSGLPLEATAVAILPITLDTPMNRKWMPKADHSSWTPLPYVAELLQSWADGKNRPNSGSLVVLTTENNETKCTLECS